MLSENYMIRMSLNKLLVINGVIYLKMLSSISSSYVFYNERQIAIEDNESYDIDS